MGQIAQTGKCRLLLQHGPPNNPVTAAQLLPHLQAMVQQPGQQYGQSFSAQPQPTYVKGMIPNAQQSFPLANTTNLPSMPGNFQQPALGQAITNGVNTIPIAQCQIPGCQQPAHVDPSGGQVSNYCSKLHREYVTSSHRS